MSVGFRSPSEGVLPRDRVLWRVTKGGREAHAIARDLESGQELRVFVGQDLTFSHMYRHHATPDALYRAALNYLADFERLGWVVAAPSGG